MRRPTLQAIGGLILCAAHVFLFTSCRAERSEYYIVGSAEQMNQLRQLFELLESGEADGEQRFILVQQISYYLLEAGYPQRRIHFLSTYVERHPFDDYNSSHLLAVAEAYLDVGATPVAIHYYEQVLLNYSDLEVQGQSIHFHCLVKLIDLVEDPEDRILYHKEIISRYGHLVNLGEVHFHLARMYEEVGEWDLAMQAYEKFLQNTEVEISGFPNARRHIREKLEFYHSRKNWTVRDLDTLVARIKGAIVTKNVKALLSYRARVNFFTRSWKSPDVPQNSYAYDFEITRFLTGRVAIARGLDEASSEREAYLRITAYEASRIPVWYLYFRRVEYEPDPEIHGSWEWAGVFFGEKL